MAELIRDLHPPQDLECVWDGAHHQHDHDLFRKPTPDRTWLPFQFTPKGEPIHKPRPRRYYSKQLGSRKAQILATMNGEWLTIREISVRVGYTRDIATRALRALEEDGLLEKQRLSGVRGAVVAFRRRS